MNQALLHFESSKNNIDLNSNFFPQSTPIPIPSTIEVNFTHSNQIWMNYLQEDINNFEQISTKLALYGIKLIEMEGKFLHFTAFLTTMQIINIAEEVFNNEIKLTFTAQNRIDLAKFSFNENKETVKNMTFTQFADLNINFLTNVPQLVNLKEIEQIICIAGGTKNQREECYHFMTDLISSIVIEDFDIELDNEIK